MDTRPIDFIRTAESYGYRIQSRPDFEAATDRPPGLLERAAASQGTHVLWDPEGAADEFMLVGDGAEHLAELWFSECFAGFPEDHQVVTYAA